MWLIIFIVSAGLGGLVYVLMFQNREQPPDYVKAVGKAGSRPGELRSPVGVAVDANGTLFVADTGNHRMQRFDANGNLEEEWGTKGVGDTRSGRRWPRTSANTAVPSAARAVGR